MRAGESYIFRSVASILFFLVNIFAIYLMLRGHNFPGGGFIGGLGAAISLIMLSLAFGVEYTQRLLRIDPMRLAAGGLLLAVATSFAPVLVGQPFLRHYHLVIDELPLFGQLVLGTPLLFDFGVFLVVIGVTAKMVFVLARPNVGLTALERQEWRRYAARQEEPIEMSAPEATPESSKEDAR